MNKRDYYEILGIERNADNETIKKAYRKLAMQYHPDRNPDDSDAENKFKEVGEAYSVLSDANRRARYDRFGHAGAQGSDPFSGFGFDSRGFDPFDLFKSVFEGFSAGFGDDIFGSARSGGRKRARKGTDISVTIKLSLEEIQTGITKKVKLKYQNICSQCNGSGSKDSGTRTCSRCNGSGEVRQVNESIFGRFVNISACPECNGEGQIVANPCSLCSGTGLERDEKVVKIGVPAGVGDGQYMRMPGEGNNAVRGGQPGDLIVHFKEKEHDLFSRHGDDILYEMHVSYSDAVLGASAEVPTLTGKVKLTIPAGTPSGKLFRLKGKGIPHVNQGGQGDQLVRVVIYVPKKVSTSERKLLEKLENEMEVVQPSKNKSFFNKVKDVFS